MRRTEVKIASPDGHRGRNDKKIKPFVNAVALNCGESNLDDSSGGRQNSQAIAIALELLVPRLKYERLRQSGDVHLIPALLVVRIGKRIKNLPVAGYCLNRIVGARELIEEPGDSTNAFQVEVSPSDNNLLIGS